MVFECYAKRDLESTGRLIIYIVPRFHKLFRGMHPNGNALPAFLGGGIMLGMYIFKPALYKGQKRKYNDCCNQMRAIPKNAGFHGVSVSAAV